MSNNRHDFARLERLAGAHHIIDERPSSCAVQNFRQRGFQPCSFSGSKQNNYKVRI
jgi:hypothetical protein